MDSKDKIAKKKDKWLLPKIKIKRLRPPFLSMPFLSSEHQQV